MTIYGYARVSTAGQSLSEQKEALKNFGADIILSEKYSGTTTARPQFEKLVHRIEPNDTCSKVNKRPACSTPRVLTDRSLFTLRHLYLL